MNEQQLAAWLNNPADYKQGIALYEAAGGNPYQLALFKKFDAPFTREKLYNELQEIKITIAKTHAAAPPLPAPTPTDHLTLPETLQAAEKEKAQLYRECFPYRKILKEVYKKQLQKIITSKQRVTVAEACALMYSSGRARRPKPFSIAYITYNRETGEAGQLIYYEHAVLSNTNHSGSRTYTGPAAEKRMQRNPNHYMNSTRNIIPLASREIRKLHIWLMVMYDGMEVTMGDPG